PSRAGRAVDAALRLRPAAVLRARDHRGPVRGVPVPRLPVVGGGPPAAVPAGARGAGAGVRALPRLPGRARRRAHHVRGRAPHPRRPGPRLVLAGGAAPCTPRGQAAVPRPPRLPPRAGAARDRARRRLMAAAPGDSRLLVEPVPRALLRLALPVLASQAL